MKFLYMLLAAGCSFAFAKPNLTRRIPEQVFKFAPTQSQESDFTKMYVSHEPKFKIAILDTGVSTSDLLLPVKLCKKGHYDFQSGSAKLNATMSHGSVVASIIGAALQNVDYCFVIYQLVNSDGDITVENTAKALKMAEHEGVIAVNLSITGVNHSYAEYLTLKELTKRGTMVFAAAGNDHRDLTGSCLAYPACYDLPNVKAVGALSDDGSQQAFYSNFGGKTKLWYIGAVQTLSGVEHGTSFAAPRALGDFVRSLDEIGKK